MTDAAQLTRVSAEIFRPLKMRKAVDEVVAVLVDAIRAGLAEPGNRLPREVDLAARLDVSRNTVSEAMARLERAGVVSIRRGNQGGATVLSRSIPSDLLLDGHEPSEILQILQARRTLETQSTLLAGQHASDANLGELRRLVEMLPALVGNVDEFVAVDFRFHVALGRFSGNALLGAYMDDLFRRLTVVRSQYPFGAIDLQQGISNQRLSLAALESRDERAILDAVDEHLASVEEHFLGRRLPRFEPAHAPSRH